MLQNALIEQLNQNLNGDDFKDFILKLNNYFLNGVEPDFDGVKKLMFEMSRPYYDYIGQKYDEKVSNSFNDEISCGNFPGTLPPNRRY